MINQDIRTQSREFQQAVEPLIDEFWNAVNEGNLSEVNRLLKIEYVLNQVSKKENSELPYRALSFAAINGHLEVLNRLLEIEAVSNMADAQENEALRWAAEKGHLKIVNRLLKLKNVHNQAAAALNNAAIHGHLPILDRLLEIETICSNQKLLAIAQIMTELIVSSEVTPEELGMNIPITESHIKVIGRLQEVQELADQFQKAVILGDLSKVNQLLTIKSVYYQAAVDDNRAIKTAAKMGHLEIVECLLQIESVREAGAQGNNKSKVYTPLRKKKVEKSMAIPSWVASLQGESKKVKMKKMKR